MIDKFYSKQSIKRYMSFTFTLWFGVFLSIIIFVIILNNNMKSLKDEFFYDASFNIENLKNEFNSYQINIELLKGFFESSNRITKKDFLNFSNILFQKGNFSNILWIDNDENNDFPYIVTYFANKDGYNNFLDFNSGINLQLYPNIIYSIKKSFKAKKPITSEHLKFLSNNSHYIALTYPVMNNNIIYGYIIAILDLGKIFDKIFFSMDSAKNKNIYILNNNTLLFKISNNKILADENIISIEELIKKSVFSYTDNINILSNNWNIIFTPTSKYIALANNLYPWLIMILGIIITSILGVLLFNLIGRNIQTEEAVRLATNEIENNKKHIEIILNTVMEGIITIDIYGIIQTFNPAAEKIFGYKSNEVIGKNVKMLMLGKNKKYHNNYIQNYINTNEAKIIGIGREVSALKKDGTKFAMGLGITETMVGNKKIFVGIVRDITQEKEDKRHLEKAKLDADKANKLKSEFLATMSHEIRTPMNGIIGMAELMSYSKLSTQQEKYLKTIQSSGELLLVLINDILDFSKIEAGELELENIPIVINALLSEVIQLLSARARENKVELAVYIDNNVPFVFLGDPTRLRQILINLLGNAIKFSKKGHVLIKVKQSNLQKNISTLKFEVIDTGIGIAEDKLDAIFEQFSQADSSTTREFGGTGLGLAICQKLVNLMGGNIGVKSVVNKGSTFWFEIKAKVEKDYVQHNIDIEGKLKDINILIIDDYQVNLDILSEYLKREEVNCDSVNCPEKALNIIKEKKVKGKPYDIILIDYDMPKISGEEMGVTISSNPKEYGNPKLILVTSLDKMPHVNFLEETGYVEKLLKPIYSSILFETIYKVYYYKDIDMYDDKTNQIINKKLPTYNAKILIVEDFKVNRDVAKNILQKLGCKVDVALDGKVALNILYKNHDYDIIFMDCQMPVMDGFKASKEIRKNKWGKDIIIVALTANALKDAKDKCLKSGMNDYISKPVKISDIIGTLDKYLK